ncbi:hypothetical protein [Clostridium hydrogenum]|uniref:hypothetical protein n=1 Tax=Clostridium hydrogenum TaxID=2855764 RepID=UPI001F297335|nr:hypothetical protein [Clostridium hydrogenum]
MSEGDKNVNKPKRKLVIKEGSEFKIKVESVQEFNDSFFKDIYDSAAVNAWEIIDNTKKYYSSAEKFKKDKEEANNIIAFVGERGTGKSSAMVSFAETLKHINDKGTNLDKLGLEKFKKLKDVSFVNLDIIDPALLEDKESIFEIIIAKMFSKFKEQMEKQSDALEYDDKKRLLKKFQKVYMDLKTINTDRKDMLKESPYSEDIIETLISLASGSNMRKSFIELVNEFLEMFGDKKDKDKRFLVIPIDDLDMNIKHSAEMAEQIRKYLMVPNVIVLMAIKMGQLKDSIEQMYRKNYEVMLKEGNLADDPKEMAERYIEKLIPNGRKLYLPDIRVHKDGIEEDIELVIEDENINKGAEEFNYVCNNGESTHKCCITKNSNLNEKSESKSDLSIEDTVLKMTYEKTGLIFIKNDYDVHYLVPDNLRELQNYLIMLNKMDDIKLIPSDDEKEKQIRLHNLEKFETYFLKNWVRRNLSRRYIKIIDEFYNTSIKKKNKYLVNAVTDEIYIKFLMKKYSYGGLDRKDYIYKISEYTRSTRLIRKGDIAETIKNIINLSNNSLNISFGDVIAVLNAYDEHLNDEEYKKFTFAIKTLYSILFYKMTKVTISFNSVKILMGGNIINTMLLEKFQNYYMFYSISDYRNLRINEASDRMKEFMDRVINDGDYCEQVDAELFKDFELINYFLVFGRENSKYRENIIPYYELNSQLSMEGSVGRKHGIINATAFITKVLDPEGTIEKAIGGYIYGEDVEKNNNIKDNYDNIYNISISKQINEQRNKIVIPIYSVELVEKIMEDTYYEFYKSYKSKSNLKFFFETFFKVLYNAVSNNYYDVNKILKLNECDNFKMDFVNNTIVDKILEIGIDEKKPSLNEHVKEILDYIEQQSETFQNDEENINILDDRIRYFSNYGRKVQIPAVKYNAKAIYNEGIEIKKGKVVLQSNFRNEFIEKVKDWIDGVNDNRSSEDEKKVDSNYIDELIDLLKREKIRLENE